MMFSADDFDLSAMNQNKETIKEITNQKKIKQEYYQTQQQNNLKRTHKAWSIKLKNLINQGHPFSIKPRIIQDFWFNEVKKSEVDINKHIHRTKRLSILEVKDYFESEDIIDSDKLDYLANAFYGSYPEFLELDIKSKKGKDKIKDWFLKRCYTIKYWIENLSFNSKINRKYIDSELKFIVSELEENDFNRQKEHLPGEQKLFFVGKQSIEERLFEYIIKINSTRGRLYVILNWEKLICMPGFNHQKYYDNVFGFQYLDEGDCSSKYLHVLIIFIENIFQGYWEIYKITQETKLNMIPKIRTKISKLAWEMKKVLTWRYLVEENIKLKKRKYW